MKRSAVRDIYHKSLVPFPHSGDGGYRLSLLLLDLRDDGLWTRESLVSYAGMPTGERNLE